MVGRADHALSNPKGEQMTSFYTVDSVNFRLAVSFGLKTNFVPETTVHFQNQDQKLNLIKFDVDMITQREIK